MGETNERTVSFAVTPAEADVLIRGLEEFGHQTHKHESEAVFDDGQDRNIALAFAAAIREQAQRPRE